LPARKKAPKGRSKFKLLTLAILCIGAGYAVFRSLRTGSSEEPSFMARTTNNDSAPQERERDQRLATAGL
jgi:hypothetical protein